MGNIVVYYIYETGFLSDDILACFEEALGDRLPEMGTDAAAGREANAESAEAAQTVVRPY